MSSRNKWCRFARTLLRPPLAILILLLPVAAALLAWVMMRLDSASPIACAVYVLSAYTLTVWCIRAPTLIRDIRRLQTSNKYIRRWREDTRLRINVSLYGTLIWNAAYAVLQLCLGVYHDSAWYYSLAGYYLSLAVMRSLLVRYTTKYAPGERPTSELRRYCACGGCFLITNLALAVMIVYMVFFDHATRHHEITTIAMAAYAFTMLARALVNAVRAKSFNSPVYSAMRAITLGAACVSMLTLEATMLTTFSSGDTDLTFRRLMLGLSGLAVGVVIIAMAIHMLVNGTKKLRSMREETQNG